MTTAIAAKDLHKSFAGVAAVQGLNFSVKIGEVLGFLGPNGAGKTTTMRLLTGYYIPDQGDIEIMGADLRADCAQCQSQIGYLPEGAPLYNSMRVIDYLKFTGGIRGLEKTHRKDSIDRVIADTQLADVLAKKIGHLSKGFKRRIALAQALINDPPVLILDEPTDGLDPNQKHHMRELLRRISARKAIILSTHILEEVESLCSRVVVIDRGKIVSDTTPKQFASGGMEQNFRRLTGNSGA